MEKNAPKKTSSEGNQEIQKDNDIRGGAIVTEEKSINGENTDPEKEVALLDQSDKDNASLIQSDSGAEVVK